jgi:hypothetical protein
MCQYAYAPSILFRPGSGRIWAEVVNHLSGYMVRVTFTDGHTVTGDLMCDGESGRYVRFMVDAGSEQVYLARSIAKLEIL